MSTSQTTRTSDRARPDPDVPPPQARLRRAGPTPAGPVDAVASRLVTLGGRVFRHPS